MFINCPHCGALVATDPATDLPPERCPRCAGRLRDEPKPAQAAPPLETGTAADATPPAAARVADAATDAAAAPMGAGLPSVVDASPGRPTNAAVVQEDAAASAPDPQEPPDVRAPSDPAPAAPDGGDGDGDGDGEQPASAPHDNVATAHAAPASIGDDGRSAGDAGGSEVPSSDRPSSSTGAGSPAAQRRDKPAPSFVRTRTPAAAATNARRRWALPTLIVGLSLLLALQWILADRARLAADAGWRPFVAQLCATLRCALPPWREPSALSLLERDVRPHPDVPGALRVTATFRNDARWPQPWPEVVLTLSDVDGRAVGARAFAAGDYLGAARTQDELASGQTATIRMDVLEPAPRAVAFAFDFR